MEEDRALRRHKLLVVVIERVTAKVHICMKARTGRQEHRGRSTKVTKRGSRERETLEQFRNP